MIIYFFANFGSFLIFGFITGFAYLVVFICFFNSDLLGVLFFGVSLTGQFAPHTLQLQLLFLLFDLVLVELLFFGGVILDMRLAYKDLFLLFGAFQGLLHEGEKVHFFLFFGRAGDRINGGQKGVLLTSVQAILVGEGSVVGGVGLMREDLRIRVSFVEKEVQVLGPAHGSELLDRLPLLELELGNVQDLAGLTQPLLLARLSHLLLYFGHHLLQSEGVEVVDFLRKRQFHQIKT